MRNRMHRRLRLAVLLAAASPALPASAKVAFTGYGNFHIPLYQEFRVRGPSSLVGTEGNLITKGFRLESAGLFATTRVGDESEFLMDLTFRNIGTNVGQTRIQYAYLDGALPWHGLRMQAGKVTLPFNYYNTRRFYPFQRLELTAPVFVNGILGLPIADAGVVLSRRFELAGDWTLDARAYGVNGYGSVSGSSVALRDPSLPGGLAMSANLGAGNNNKDVAWGGQLALGRSGTGEAGLSYYRGAWDPQGRRVLQMAGAHALWQPWGFDILAEYLHLHVTGDEGLLPVLHSRTWTTNGAFLTASRRLFELGGRPVDGWLHGENYHSAGRGGGPREVLRSYSGGLRALVNENVALKSEYLHLYYRLPNSPADVTLEGYSAQGSVVITF